MLCFLQKWHFTSIGNRKDRTESVGWCFRLISKNLFINSSSFELTQLCWLKWLFGMATESIYFYNPFEQLKIISYQLLRRMIKIVLYYVYRRSLNLQTIQIVSPKRFFHNRIRPSVSWNYFIRTWNVTWKWHLPTHKLLATQLIQQKAISRVARHRLSCHLKINN